MSDVRLASGTNLGQETGPGSGARRRAPGGPDSSLDLGSLPDVESPSGAARSDVRPEEGAEWAGEEPAVEATEEEAPAAALAEDRPARREPAQAAGRGVAWAGGALLGLAIGTMVCLGLWMAHVEPPGSWRGDAAKAAGGAGAGAAPAPGPANAVVAPAGMSRVDLLRAGEWERAAQAGIEQVEGDNPEALAERGEYRWLTYLQKAGGRVAKDDPAVQAAAADLQKAADANNADALFWLGHLQETTGQADKARATYDKGAKAFKDDPGQRGRFEAALHRLDLRAPARAARGPVGADGLTLMLVALQPPPAGDKAAAGPASRAGEEAGTEFWQAADLARQHKYAEAVKAIDAAKALHEQRRFARMRKAQNPLSDPTEEIFLRACDELKAYWQLQDKLRAAGYLDVAENSDPARAVDALVARAKEGGGAKGLADKLIQEKVIEKPEDVARGVDDLLAGRKKAEEERADLEGKLKKARAAGEMAMRDEAKARDRSGQLSKGVAELDAKLTEAQAREKELQEQSGEAGAVLKRVEDELARARFLDPREGRGAVLPGLRAALRKAAQADARAEGPPSRPAEEAKGPPATAPERSAPRRVEVPASANPQDAERYYAEGLHDYFAGRYGAAEREFGEAVALDAADARYHYFLGLARLRQGKGAGDEFRQGAALEWQDRPPREAVSAALERVQGPVRRTVNEARVQPQ
jgi:TolA-binding protein